MPTQSSHKKPFLIVAFTFVALVVISAVFPTSFWAALRINQVLIYADVVKPIETKHASTYHKKTEALKDLVADTIEANKAVSKLIRNDVAIEFADTSGENLGLDNFLAALHQLQLKKNKKVRIGYFGDSMIEGDLITQTIRSILQNKYGGNGVGYIPVTSVVEHFRQTVKVTSSENWDDVSYINNKEKRIIGFSGHTFYPQQASTVTIKPGGGKHLSLLYNLSILFGAGNDGLVFNYNNTAIKVLGDKHFNMARLSEDTNLTKVSLSFNASTTPIFGFASESKTGLILDNLSFRGTSGTEITRLNSKMLRQIDSLRHYDLIVLQYGPNLLYNDSITNFDYYQKQLIKSIKHIRKSFPNTSILIISTADKAFKINGEYRTGNGVEALLKAQQNAAQKTNCAFYNLYEAMGGYNSMKTWAEKKPILAGSDYTHFNQSGSAKIGRLIGNALLNEYEKKYPTN